jgi:hypothetical protein
MTFMDESTLLAHALRDFLRPQVSSSDMLSMDVPLQAGEPLSALDSGLSLAAEHDIALPPIFSEKILGISGLSDEYLRMFREDLSRVPPWFQLAS